MPRGMFKSRTLRRVFKRVPSGSTKLHYIERKPKQAHSGRCGSILHGSPRTRPIDMKRLAKSEKRPERPFGGVLCSACLRDMIKVESRE